MGLAGHFYCTRTQALSGTKKTAVAQQRPQSKVYLAIVWYCFVISDKIAASSLFVTNAYFLEHTNERILSCSDYPDFSLSFYGIHDIYFINRVH